MFTTISREIDANYKTGREAGDRLARLYVGVGVVSEQGKKDAYEHPEDTLKMLVKCKMLNQKVKKEDRQTIQEAIEAVAEIIKAKTTVAILSSVVDSTQRGEPPNYKIAKGQFDFLAKRTEELMNMNSVNFLGVNYPIRKIPNGEGLIYTIATNALRNAIHSEDGDLHEKAENIDEMVDFYVDLDVMFYPENEFLNYMSEKNDLRVAV